MCGIFAILRAAKGAAHSRDLAVSQARKIRHRGPDWSGVYSKGTTLLLHERNSIIDPMHGDQPLYSPEGDIVLIANGEIYNHKTIKEEYKFEDQMTTQSDCEVVIPLYKKLGATKDMFRSLVGMFGLVLYDEKLDFFVIARDHIGIIPLYYGHDDTGAIYVASELKALVGICKKFQEFPPGHFLTSDMLKPQRWYEPKWYHHDTEIDSKTSKLIGEETKTATIIPSPLPPRPSGKSMKKKQQTPAEKYAPAAAAASVFDTSKMLKMATSDELSILRDAFTDSVRRHLMCDVPYGVLLSGGLDSSLVSAIAVKIAREEKHSSEKIKSFSVGLKGSPDLKAARKVADFLGTDHHEFEFTVQQGIDMLSDVVYFLETYDVTTIRASTPMFLMSRRIRSLGVKAVLSGEGADEIFGGYLYFHKAPNAVEFHQETVRKLKSLHLYDCLRANKSTAAWGVEARVPFLDSKFLEVAMSIDPTYKMTSTNDKKIEKYILRKAFDGYLPDEILWRQKEQFSDGVGYSWIDMLRSLAETQISDKEFFTAATVFPHNPPATKEAFMYRKLFHAHYPQHDAALCVPGGPSIACSTATAIEWDASFKNAADPSGRAVGGVHEQAYKPQREAESVSPTEIKQMPKRSRFVAPTSL